HVGTALRNPLDEALAQLQQPRQMLQHLRKPHHGDLFGVPPGLAPRCNHLGPRKPDKLRVGHLLPNPLDQRGPQRIPRRLRRRHPTLPPLPTPRGVPPPGPAQAATESGRWGSGGLGRARGLAETRREYIPVGLSPASLRATVSPRPCAHPSPLELRL